MRKLGPTPSRRAAGRASLLLICLTGLGLQGCTDLGEDPLSSTRPENFYRTEQELLGGLAAVYSQMRGTLWQYYNVSEISSDEMIVPTRGPDWFDNGRWLELHYQDWNATSLTALSNDELNGAWNDMFRGVARANVLLSVLPDAQIADRDAVIAEVRTLRAFYYYILMDLFGGVPIVEDTEIRARPRNTRAELFQFIESELLAAREDLPERWPPVSHGRMTRGAADALLASIYLNAEVFTGTVTDAGLQRGQARWADALAAADRILLSGQYSLPADWRINFSPDNSNSPENILVIKALPMPGLGINNHFYYRGGHYNEGIGGGWNGFSALAETYYAFDTLRIDTLVVQRLTIDRETFTDTLKLLRSRDTRHDIFIDGLVLNVETGQPVTYTNSDVPLYYSPHFPHGERSASQADGVRYRKWPIDPNRSGDQHGNDYAFFRLAEIYLIKAEAHNELGQTAEAITAVNAVRARAFNPPQPLTGVFTQTGLREAILRERHMELTAESKRRQDLIRHGRFLRAWSFKQSKDHEPYRVQMPIPQPQLIANPELVQNCGYGTPCMP